MELSEYYLSLYWRKDSSTAGNFLRTLFLTVNELRKALPEFPTASLISPISGMVPLPENEEAFISIVLPELFNESAWYFSGSGEKSQELRSDSRSDSGFVAELLFENDTDAFTILFTAGLNSHEEGQQGRTVPNSVVINFPSGTYPPLSQMTFVKELFKKLITLWRPSMGTVTHTDIADSLNLNVGIMPPGWMIYLDDKRVRADWFHKGMAERCEGGELIILNEVPVSKKDKNFMDQVREIWVSPAIETIFLI